MAILKITKTCHRDVLGGHLDELEIEVCHDPERGGSASFSVPDMSSIKSGMKGPIWGQGRAGHRVVVGPPKSGVH